MQGHTAYGILPVVDKLPLKIESIDVWARGPNTPSTLVVGTSEGVLLVYDINPASDGKSPPQVNMREPLKTFAKNKAIMQLAVVEKWNMLISLSDSYISIHDLTSFALRTQIAKSKGCHLFTVDTTKPALTMCVAVKKRLSIYQYDGNDWTEIRELPLADQARTVTWCGNSLFVGFKSNYYMVHVQTGTTTELFSTGRNQTPVACLLPNEQVLLNKDDISIFLGFDGKTTRKFGLSWTEAPQALGHHFPYVLALLPKTIEVRTTFGTQTLVQQVQLKTGAKGIVVKNNDIYISAQNQVWKLVPVPIIDQVEQLVRERKYEEALILCENLAVEDESQRNSMRKMIKTLHAYSLFAGGQYARAMEYYLELDLDPLQVIGLYPNLLPKNLRDKFTYPIEIPQLAGAPLEKAMQALINYLTQIRPSVVPNASARNDSDYALTADLAQIIDTSLLKAYIKTNEQLVLPLVSLTNNNCHVNESEKVLTSFGKYVELVTLFRAKGMHRQALLLLASLGQYVPNAQQPAGRPPPLGKVIGPKETIKYLKLLSTKEFPLILEFSQWPLQVAPEEAFEIFTEERLPPLPAIEVLAHVKLCAPILTVHLLEYLIHEQKETSADIHNELVFIYLERILQIRQAQPAPAAGRMMAGTEPGVLGETRSKLIKFLQTTTSYNPEKMLSRFPLNDLLEERAILLSRIGQHEQALIIYAHKLHDDKMAEDYCARHYNPDVESSRDVYLALLKVYLRPAADGSIRVAPALSLLNKHFQELDAAKALELLPPNTSVSKLYPFLEAVVRDRGRKRRENQVAKNLLKTENLHLRESLIQARSRMLRITEERDCPVCNKKIGASVFAAYPNGIIVHYSCFKDKNVCPVTGQRFNTPEAVMAQQMGVKP